ncbi:alcohol dehydrogenase 1-like [Mauremys reevesii]|uniref:alcohol dehydrogenase 1-like n=1 Tax=Mauremys reevesii TaxID=260615 RepID=UPI00193F1E8D|nr:alcohol dehydrogenase 1-like [Mauremys reevesii]
MELLEAHATPPELSFLLVHPVSASLGCRKMAALLSCHLGYGICVLVGEPRSGSQISFDPLLLFTGRQWKYSQHSVV